jgi:flagellar hook-associated protein 2
MGGLVSGLDVDTLIEQMTATSRQKILKQKQNIQKLEWKQTAYRSVTSSLKEFQSKYLDVLSTTNLRSTSFLNAVKASSSSNSVAVSSTSGAVPGTIKIDSITQLATYQKIEMAAGATATKELKSSSTVSNIISGLTAGDSISLNLDGKVRTISFSSDFVTAVNSDPSQFESRLQSLIDKAYGVTGDSDRVVKVDTTDGYLSLSAPGSKLTLNDINSEKPVLEKLGFTSGQSTKITTGMSLADLKDSFATSLSGSGTYSFSINGENFSFDSSASLSSVMSKINSSDAGVTITYSSVTDRFTMTAKSSGAGDNIQISDKSGNLMSALGLTESSGAVSTAGVNAILSVNGQTIIRSSNTFEVDGAKLTLNNTSEEAINITMTSDASSLKDTIKTFVEDYNAMVDLMNGLVKEKTYSDYEPLSDEQKEEMSESEIKSWEEKSKSGILKGDSLLRSISSKLHSVMTGLSVNGFSLYSMGITSAGYTENGKLQIDEAKLQTALETRGSEIRELFTSTDGIGNKLNDVINGATKTSGVKGSRGSLVEAAGVANTTSATENGIYDQIERSNKTLKTLQTRLTAEERRLWNKFTAMESAINSLNTQGSIISQFSTSSNS